jgi:hypothetical protein
VVFGHQFTLGASEEIYPPGRYAIETAEECYERNGHTAHVRTATALIVSTASGTRSVQIKDNQLQAALEADAEQQRHDCEIENTCIEASQEREPDALQAQLERYGIDRVPADVFVWHGYKYTHAADAIAAARRATTT